jgi:glutathione S-transferase
MKLYYVQGACSLAPHIALLEVGLDFKLVRFDTHNQSLEGGGKLQEVNSKGYVPVLELDNGERLTEASAVLQYIADQAPQSGLAPPPGSFERYRLQEWLNYLASEVHKSFWPFFHSGCESEKANQRERLLSRFEWLEKRLGDKPFLMGDTFTVADAYLLTMLNWLRPAGFDISQWPRLKAYRARLRERPAVRAALNAEGLLKTERGTQAGAG